MPGDCCASWSQNTVLQKLGHTKPHPHVGPPHLFFKGLPIVQRHAHHLSVPTSEKSALSSMILASEDSAPPLPELPALLDSPEPDPEPDPVPEPLTPFPAICGTSSLATNDPPSPSSPCVTPAAILPVAILTASLSVSPVSSSAARNLASSLHSSQSCSRIALLNSRTLCSDAVASSSNVCRMSR